MPPQKEYKGIRKGACPEACPRSVLSGIINRGDLKGKEGDMAFYIVLSSLTDEGRKTIKEKPERILEVNKEIEKMGVKVVKQYAVLGPYDFVNIVEAPDNETVMRMSVELGARGSVQLLTLAAVPVEEFIKKLK